MNTSVNCFRRSKLNAEWVIKSNVVKYESWATCTDTMWCSTQTIKWRWTIKRNWRQVVSAMSIENKNNHVTEYSEVKMKWLWALSFFSMKNKKGSHSDVMPTGLSASQVESWTRICVAWTQNWDMEIHNDMRSDGIKAVEVNLKVHSDVGNDPKQQCAVVLAYWNCSLRWNVHNQNEG